MSRPAEFVAAAERRAVQDKEEKKVFSNSRFFLKRKVQNYLPREMVSIVKQLHEKVTE